MAADYVSENALLVSDEYDSFIYGIPQVEGIHYETLSLFKSATHNAWRRGLVNSWLFVAGETENMIIQKDFLSD